MGNVITKELERPVHETLTEGQKEIIKLLQKKGAVMTDNKEHIIVTYGKTTKKVNLHTFYNLINKGFIYRQTDWPFNFILSHTGRNY